MPHENILYMSEIHHVFPTIEMCMIYEKKISIGVYDKQPSVHVWNVGSCDLRVFLDDSLVGSNIKRYSVIHWCIGVSVQALSKVLFSKKKTPHAKPIRIIPRTQIITHW